MNNFDMGTDCYFDKIMPVKVFFKEQEQELCEAAWYLDKKRTRSLIGITAVVAAFVITFLLDFFLNTHAPMQLVAAAVLVLCLAAILIKSNRELHAAAKKLAEETDFKNCYTYDELTVSDLEMFTFGFHDTDPFYADVYFEIKETKNLFLITDERRTYIVGKRWFDCESDIVRMQKIAKLYKKMPTKILNFEEAKRR